MDEEKSPLTAQDGRPAPEAAAEIDAAAETDAVSENVTPPKRPEYTKKQRVIALLGAIFVVIVTLMYAYSISTGDLFFR